MSDTLEAIIQEVVDGELKDIAPLVRRALKEGIGAETILRDGIIQGLEVVGKNFQDNTFFVSDMLYSSKIAKKGISVLKPHLENVSHHLHHHRVVMGTVEGDLHDIGKDLVATVMRLNGFEVVDLGIDVSGKAFLEALEKYPDTEIVCLSALLTATMPAMRDIVAMLRRADPEGRVKIRVGGAPVSQAFADVIGADAYSENALAAVEKARQLCGETGAY